MNYHIYNPIYTTKRTEESLILAVFYLVTHYFLDTHDYSSTKIFSTHMHAFSSIILLNRYLFFVNFFYKCNFEVSTHVPSGLFHPIRGLVFFFVCRSPPLYGSFISCPGPGPRGRWVLRIVLLVLLMTMMVANFTIS